MLAKLLYLNTNYPNS